MKYNIAVVGATGAVGREMLRTLAREISQLIRYMLLPQHALLAAKSLMVMMPS